MRSDRLNHIFCNFIVFNTIKTETLYIGLSFSLNLACKPLVKVPHIILIMHLFKIHNIVLYFGAWVTERSFRLLFKIILFKYLIHSGFFWLIFMKAQLHTHKAYGPCSKELRQTVVRFLLP